jgi:hypothetical protein
MQDEEYQPEQPNVDNPKLEQQELLRLEERLGNSMHFNARADYTHELKDRLLRDLRQSPRQPHKITFGFRVGGASASAALVLVIGIIVLTGINLFSDSTYIKPSVYAEQSSDLAAVTEVGVVQTKPSVTAPVQVVKLDQEVYEVESSLLYAKLKRVNLLHSESSKDSSRLLPSPH